MQPGDQIGDYRIESKIGEGGMSIVYGAIDSNGTRVVVKELKHQYLSSRQLIDRFVRGATILKDLRHPHLARVFDVLEHNGRHLIVEEYLSGGSLADLLVRGGPPDQREALQWCRDALRALNYVHEFAIVHRDIKPSNLMLDGQGRVRVIDFGIARVFGEVRLTRTGDGAMGTPWYMSPEQIVTPAGVDHLTDVYSAGIVLYELLTGQVPFQGTSDFSIHEKITRQPPPVMSTFKAGIDPRLEKIVRQALEKDRKQRHGGCGEFAQAIDRYLSRGPKRTWAARLRETGAAITAAARSLRPRPAVVALAIAVIVLLVGLLNGERLSAVLSKGDTQSLSLAAIALPSSVTAPGTVVTFEYRVTNTGTAPLRNVKVDDGGETSPTLASGDTNSNSLLDTNETWLFGSTLTVDSSSQWNAAGAARRTIRVAADGISAEPVLLEVPFEQRAAVAIATLVNDRASVEVLQAGRLSYSYRVSNAGNVALTNVRVIDRHGTTPALRAGDTNGNRALDVDETWEFRADLTVSGGQLDNGGFSSRAVVMADQTKAEASEVPVIVRRPPTVTGSPRRLVHAQPEYPPEAQAANIQGTVRLELTIGADGRVQRARVQPGSEPGSPPAPGQLWMLLERAAIAAALKWEYAPTLVNGVAVRVVTTTNVRFVLVPPKSQSTGESGTPLPPPVRVGGAIKSPEKIRHAAPVYPSVARSARVQGGVIVEATIGTDGRVDEIRVVRSIPSLDQAALDAVRQWEFRPTTLNGT